MEADKIVDNKNDVIYNKYRKRGNRTVATFRKLSMLWRFGNSHNTVNRLWGRRFTFSFRQFSTSNMYRLKMPV